MGAARPPVLRTPVVVTLRPARLRPPWLIAWPTISGRTISMPTIRRPTIPGPRSEGFAVAIRRSIRSRRSVGRKSRSIRSGRAASLKSRSDPLAQERLARFFRRSPQATASKPHHHRVGVLRLDLAERGEQLVGGRRAKRRRLVAEDDGPVCVAWRHGSEPGLAFQPLQLLNQRRAFQVQQPRGAHLVA